MQDEPLQGFPTALQAIIEDTNELGFDMASEPKTGALLKSLAASKPGGKFLELGTGTGLSAAWMLSGMDAKSTLVSIDTDSGAQGIASTHLGHDSRISIVHVDAAEWIQKNQSKRFDLVFADAWPGKFFHLDLALNLLSDGGIYLMDDLLPQENWPEEHALRIPELLCSIESMPGFTSVRMAWASGLMLVVKSDSL